ncbi:MAG: O-methyltransferase [Micropepsaceae bacterium]
MTRKSDDSFEAVNYALRPSKVIARKVIFDCLRRARETLQEVSYEYVGMGSIWFVDFVMAHRALQIEKMTSIEASDIGYARARFNAPFACIRVKHGYTTDVLPTLGLDKRATIIWLDYDTAIDDGPFIEDIDYLVDNVAPASILLFTVNAEIGKLLRRINPQNPDKVRPKDVENHLMRRLGQSVPVQLTSDQLEPDTFASLVAGMLMSRIENSLRRTSRNLQFAPMFNFVYRDGPRMATAGGMVGDDLLLNDIRKQTSRTGWPGIIPTPIQAPPLTLREKMAIDRLLPLARRPSKLRVQQEAGFPLSTKQIDAYFRYYAHYPAFAEIYF